MTIEQGDQLLSVGQSFTFSVRVSTVGGADEGVEWSSSAPTVATVDPSGTVIARAPGTAKITATSVFDTSKSASIQLTVTESGEPVNPAVLNVEIMEGDQTLLLGSELKLTAEVSVVGGAYAGVTWASDAPTVLGVDSAGIVDARSVGIARVTATSVFDESQQDTVVVTVIDIQPSITDTISAGEFHVLALSPSGEVWTWGFNEFGQLGDGSMIDDVTPEVVAGLPKVVKVAAGNLHSLALTETGNVWAWGDNGGSQSGLDAILTTRTASPNLIEGLHSVIDIAGGYSHSLALRADGTVWGWGSNWDGALGSGPTWNRHVAEPILGIEDVIQIAAGSGHSLALRSDGTVWGWGNSMYGQAGVEGVDKSPIPTRIEGLSDVKAIAAGWDYNLALRNDGTVWTWGFDILEQVDHGSQPRRVPNSEGVVSIATGSWHALAARADGTVSAWGYNAYGQLGDFAFDSEPHTVPGVSGAVAVTGSYMSSFALTDSGDVLSWGSNQYGELGDGVRLHSAIPIEMVSAPPVTDVDTTLPAHTATAN